MPDAFKKLVAETIEPWKNLPLKWVNAENWHLTLAFLGSIAENCALLLCSSIEAYLIQEQSFSLLTKGIDYFPSRKKARVLAVLFETSEPLQTLVQGIHTICKSQHILPDEKIFHAHITLARLKTKTAPDIDIPPFAATLPVQQVVFFKSTLHPKGVQYEPIQVFNLCLKNAS